LRRSDRPPHHKFQVPEKRIFQGSSSTDEKKITRAQRRILLRRLQAGSERAGFASAAAGAGGAVVAAGPRRDGGPAAASHSRRPWILLPGPGPQQQEQQHQQHHQWRPCLEFQGTFSRTGPSHLDVFQRKLPFSDLPPKAGRACAFDAGSDDARRGLPFLGAASAESAGCTSPCRTQ